MIAMRVNGDYTINYRVLIFQYGILTR